MGEAWTDFQRLFAASLSSEIPLLDKANRFILEHGGKKLRPTFTLLIAKALRGLCNERVVRCAAAAELLAAAKQGGVAEAAAALDNVQAILDQQAFLAAKHARQLK